MLFNSFHFLLFFPLVTMVYFLLPHRVRWVWLLVASYYFYMSWNPRYAVLIALSTLITYGSGLLIDRSRKHQDEKKRTRQQKTWVALSFLSNLGILFFFKYFTFALTNLNAVLGLLNVEVLQIHFDVLLPVGISFYTFQALSYTMDVYRGDIYAERNFFKYALFVSFFPQLVAGPIERSKNLLVQINEKHSFNFERMRRGLLLMLWGFFEKMVVADRIAILVDYVFQNPYQFEGVQLVVAMVLFAFQIYCDFAGYSDIAIGAAEIMGFRLMQNFRRPYFATGIQDFWRRWHISLSTWFRDYLYIPLGGSRGSRLKKYRNVLITFLASGLWHGASWNFVIWGLLHGGYQIAGEVTKPARRRMWNKLGVDQQGKGYRIWCSLATFVLVDFAWIFFRAPSFTFALDTIRRMFRFNPWVLFDKSLYAMGPSERNFWMMLLAIAILMVGNYLQSRMVVRDVVVKRGIIIRWAFYYAAIFFVLVFGIYGPGYDATQFIYFQF